MFTTPCFIRKNTPELREKLEKLGYNICPCALFYNACWLDTNVETVHGIGYSDETYPLPQEELLKRFLAENEISNTPLIDLDHTHYESLDEECIDFYMNNVDLIKEDWRLGGFQQTGYTHVKFSYGYTKRTMTFEIESITIGKGKPEWGAPAEEVYIIKLGKRV